jgi:hypothetical protein
MLLYYIKMSNYYNDIDVIIKKCKKDKYDNMINNNYCLSNESKIYIDNIFKKKVEIPDSKDNIMNEYHSLIYKNYWHKLKPIHQKNKLKEYITNLPTDESNKKKIMENVFYAVDEKILTRKNNVDYDHITTSIIKIKGLNFNEEENVYTFDI